MKRSTFLLLIPLVSLAPGCNHPSSLPLRDPNISQLKLDQHPSNNASGSPFSKSLPLQNLGFQNKN